MTYDSLFDKVHGAGFFNPGNSGATKYEGNLGHVLNVIENIVSSTERTNEDNLALILYAPRIIRAVLDYKIEEPSVRNVTEIVNASTDLALKVYSGVDCEEEIENFRKKLISSRNRNVLTRYFEQNPDATTWDVSSPTYSRKSLRKLVEGLGQPLFEEDILFIALGHGGIGAGMDLYLRYKDLKTRVFGQEDASTFYPVRLSTRKKRDVVPRLKKSEIEFLKRMSVTENIFLFDEDTCSGLTLDIAKDYFSEILGSHITPIVNKQV